MRKIHNILWFVLLMLCACTNDDDTKDKPSSGGESLSLTWSAACDTYRLNVEAAGDWRIETDAGWLFIAEEQRSGVGNGYVDVYVEQNSNDSRRTADIVLWCNGTALKTWHIIQQGKDEGGENVIFTSDLNKTYAAGWGYNAFGEYASENDIKGQIINYAKLKSFENIDNIANDEEQYELNYSKSVAYSVSEFSKTITKETNAKTKILFYKKEVNKRTTTTTSTKNECSFATLSVLNIVAQRNLSESSIKLLLERDKDILTDDFKQSIVDVKYGYMTPREFINKFGTDAVLTSWLGGRLDYTTTIKKTTTTEVEQVVTTTYKKLFKKSSSMTEEEKKFSEKIDVDYDCTCYVKGGDTKNIGKEINEKISKKQPIDDKIFVNWESSFHDARAMLVSGKATLVDTRTIPIYELIVDEDVSRRIENEINIMAGSDTFPADDNNDWCYSFSIPAGLDNMNLVVQPGKESHVLAEVCREFVPCIRSDKSVVVVYPVLADGKVNHERGFFVGDKEENAPGRVVWRNGVAEYYVDANYSSTEVINSLYIYNFGIYSKHEDYMPDAVSASSVHADDRTSVGLRVVKIGEQYWGFKNHLYGYSGSPGIIDSNYSIPGRKDIFDLQKSLLNDFSLLFSKDGRSGLNLPNDNFWLSCTDGPVCIYLNGAYKFFGSNDYNGKVNSLFLRKNSFRYE